MKKILVLVTLSALIVIFMSFAINTQPQKKTNKHQTISVEKLTCDCSTPPQVTSISFSGSTVNLSWSGSYDSYSVGGYYNCGGTFNFCVTGNSYSFPAPCGGTLRITGNCGTTNCTNATCSSNPSSPATF